MSSPIKSTLNTTGSVAGTAASPSMSDLLNRLQAQAGGADGANPQLAFSQWMDKHAILGDAPGAQNTPRNSAPKPASDTQPTDANATAGTTAEELLARQRMQAAQQDSPLEQAAPQPAKQPDKTTARKAEANAKPARKEGTGKTTDKTEAKDGKDADEADEASSRTAKGDGATMVRELTPPPAIQPGDSAGMMAWLAGLSHGDAHGDAHGKAAAALGDTGGQFNGLGQGTDGRLADALQTDKADPKGAHGGLALDNALWQAASGTAGLTSEALLSQSGRGGALESRSEVDPLAGLLHGNGLKPAFGAGEAAQGVPKESATLATPLNSPDFAQALSDQVSMWVSSTQPDGSMSAELHLNPAEMGPINVKISLDGQNAQVDFVAAALETRQAIEASLPMLSSALSDVGLSMTGGDVSSQQSFSQSFAQSNGSQGNGQGGHRGGDAGPDVAGMRAVNAPLTGGRAGGLDLYA